MLGVTRISEVFCSKMGSLVPVPILEYLRKFSPDSYLHPWLSTPGPPTPPMVAPSRPEVSRLSDTSVLLQWTLAPPPSLATPPTPLGPPPQSSAANHLSAFKVQYKDVGGEEGGVGVWRTVGEEIAPTARVYEVQRLRPGQ